MLLGKKKFNHIYMKICIQNIYEDFLELVDAILSFKLDGGMHFGIIC
jgi:hypothetical protein